MPSAKSTARVTRALAVHQPGVVRLARQTKTSSCKVGVRIALDEVKLQCLVRNAGATWDKPGRLWRMPLSVAHALGLADRVVELRTKARLAAATGC